MQEEIERIKNDNKFYKEEIEKGKFLCLSRKQVKDIDFLLRIIDLLNKRNKLNSKPIFVKYEIFSRCKIEIETETRYEKYADVNVIIKEEELEVQFRDGGKKIYNKEKIESFYIKEGV